MTEYIITMTSDQLHKTLKSVELLMRLKLGQYQELVYNLCDIRDPKLAERISEADDILKNAFMLINKDKKPSEYKDEEWNVLYDIFQILRKAVHDAEYPESSSIDAFPPIQCSKQPMPKVEWRRR